MTDLETFAKFTLERGGIWHEIEKKGRFAMYKTCDRYEQNNFIWNDIIVYQIFKDGMRVLATTDYKAAVQSFDRMTGGAEDGTN